MRLLLVLVLGGVANAADNPPMTDPMPSPWASYADVLAGVKGGSTLNIAVGVPAPAGYVAVKDAESYGVTKGLWKCFPLNGVAKMEPAAVSVVVAPPSRPVLPYTVLPNVQSWLGREHCVGNT